jgi:hypothetical protein
MTMCAVQDAGTIELFFYDELPGPERAEVERHLLGCDECKAALEELRLIKDALAARPAVAGPPSGDWTAFMSRLDAAVQAADRHQVVVPFVPRRSVARTSFTGLLATAALLAIVSISVFLASQSGRQLVAEPAGELEPATIVDTRVDGETGSTGAAAEHAGLMSVGSRHLERSKLVVLGLAAKEPAGSALSDWAYERELATSLLNDTRLYRLAAEERGLTSLANVMRDLELVLLQTAMVEPGDESSLPQIQRLIRKRGLVEKMDVVGTIGLVP